MALTPATGLADYASGISTAALQVNSDTGQVSIGTDSPTTARLRVGTAITMSVGVITATDAVFRGNVSIAGTLTYDDVTNIDSIGIVTARSGVYFGSPVVSAIESNSATTTTTSQTSIDSFSASEYRSAKYQVQVTQGSSYQVTEISIVHDGSDSYGTEYATIKTGSSLASFSTDISEGNVRLLATPSSSSSTVFKFMKIILDLFCSNKSSID